MRRIEIIILMAAISLFLISTKSHSCTAFCLIDGNRPVVGKNYDWSIENGLLIVNKKGVRKTAFQYQGIEFGRPVEWKSKYGSITFNQFGREFPMGGMNEAGLVVEVLMLTDTVYPEKDSRRSISVLQWVQYQLDNFKTVEEVIASNSDIRILPALSGPGMHYFICDRNGNTAVIELLNGEFVSYTDLKMPVRVLTNSTYAQGVQSRDYRKSAKSNRYGRSDRFNRAADLLERYKTDKRGDPVEYAFEILAGVSQGSFTKWSIVYDVQASEIYFRTFSNNQIRTISMQHFDYSCMSPVLILDIDNMISGDASGDFIRYTQKDNRLLVENIFRSINVDEAIREKVFRRAVTYPDENVCVETPEPMQLN